MSNKLDPRDGYVVMQVLQNTEFTTHEGHLFSPKAKVPFYVPVSCVADAMKVGAGLVNGEELPLETMREAIKPSTGQVFEDEVVSVFYKLIAENNPNDFGGNGKPLVAAMKRELGYKIDRVDIERLWDKCDPIGNHME